MRGGYQYQQFIWFGFKYKQEPPTRKIKATYFPSEIAWEYTYYIHDFLKKPLSVYAIYVVYPMETLLLVTYWSVKQNITLLTYV